MQNEVAVIEAQPVQRVQDFAALTDSTSFGQLQRAAQLFSASKLVPEIYRGNVADCFVACEMAVRLGISPLMLMQGMAPVYGKPAMEGKLVTALINTSGLFVDSLDYEIVGDDPKSSDYKVRAFATRKKTGKTLYGPWVDWAIVKGEKWDDKNGSKWKTIPSLMFMYRAAAFFGRTHCPERLMGMQTADEIQDVIVDQAPSQAALDALNAEVRGSLPETPETSSEQDQKPEPPKQTKQTRKSKSQEAPSEPVRSQPEPLPIQTEENASEANPEPVFVPSGQELKDMVSKWPGPDQERFRDFYKKSISEGVTPEQARADAWEHVGKDVQAIYESQNPEG